MTLWESHAPNNRTSSSLQLTQALIRLSYLSTITSFPLRYSYSCMAFQKKRQLFPRLLYLLSRSPQISLQLFLRLLVLNLLLTFQFILAVRFRQQHPGSGENGFLPRHIVDSDNEAVLHKYRSQYVYRLYWMHSAQLYPLLYG